MVHYRVLVGYFRESPRGSQNLVAPAAGASCRRLVPAPVCDDSYTLSALFGSPVPDRCRTRAGSQFGLILVSLSFWFPVRSQFGPNLVPVWSQFGPSLVPIWSQFDPSLVPVLSQFGPSFVPVSSQFGASLVPVWSQFGPSLVPVWC